MRLKLSIIVLAVFTLTASPSVFSQARGEVRKTARVSSAESPAADPDAPVKAPTPAETNPEAAPQGEPLVRVYLVGGRRLDVEELTESADGYWYRRGNVTTLLEKARVERIERGPQEAAPSEDKATGDWSLLDIGRVEDFFVARFGRPLPVTAFGQSDLHTRWGLDHRRSLDVGLHPDSPEGSALIEFLRKEGIPFLAFRHAVAGAATAPHIHIGRPSPGLRAR